jgi:hypothetical protein
LDILCLDLEGVLIPEIWQAVADRTGIEALRKTTRDIPVYDELMQLRLGLLAEHDLPLSLIQQVIDLWSRCRAAPSSRLGPAAVSGGHHFRHVLSVRHAADGQARLADAAVPQLVVENDRIVDYRSASPIPSAFGAGVPLAQLPGAGRR